MVKKVLISTFFLIFISCEVSDDEHGAVPCNNQYDCAGSQLCIDGFCQDGCISHSDCPINYNCIDGKCVIDQNHENNSPDNSNSQNQNNSESSETEKDDDEKGEQPDENSSETDDKNSENNEKPDEENSEKPDNDTSIVSCSDHEDCSEDKYCFKGNCIDPFINKWRIGQIDLCVNEKTSDGKNWDPLVSITKMAPEPYVIAYFNGKEVFKTSYPDDKHCATYSNIYETYLIPNDVLQFDVWDKDSDVDVVDGDDFIETIKVTPILVKYLREGKFSATGMTNMKTFNFLISYVEE